MPVSYDQRATPLAANPANTAFSNGIVLGYDFTGHDAAHANGVPWIYAGASAPNLATSGTQALQTVAGEPGRVAAASSLYDVTNLTNYGLQVGTGDFTAAIRMTTPATLPTTSNLREILRFSGSGGTALSLNLVENPNNGWYLTGVGSTAVPFGTTQSAIMYGANTAIMIWVQRISGVVTIFTQNATAQTDAVVRFAAGAAASASLDSTRAARLVLNYGPTVTTPAMQAFTFWNVGLSSATISAIGKDYYSIQTNGVAAATLAITSPAANSTISGTSVISGTYTGDPPTGIEVQLGAGSWVAGTSPTIGGGTWSASFTLPAGGPSTLTARETNAPAVVSASIANITVDTDAITITSPAPYALYQRDGNNQAVVTVSLTYVGSPTSIEYQWNGGAWSALGGTMGAGAASNTKTLTGPAQGALAVRFANKPAVTASVAAVGVGDLYLVAGQSNHVGGGAGTYVPAVAPGAHPGWIATILDKTGTWRPNYETSTDPFSKTTNATTFPAASATYSVQAQSPNAYNSYFGRLATQLMATGVPVAFIPCALGSTLISQWAPSTNTNTLYGAALARALQVGNHKALLWWQGEADSLAGNPQAAHETALNAIIDDWFARTGRPTVVMNINSAGTGAGYAAIHAAIANVGTQNTHVAGLADMNGAFAGLHYASGSEINEVANRAYIAVTSTPSVIAASVGSALATGAQANIIRPVTILAQVGTAVATGLTATVSNGLTVAAQLGTAIATGLTAAVSSAVNILCSVGSATATGSTADVGIVAGNTPIDLITGTALATGATAQITIIAPPVEAPGEPITLAQAKNHLRVYGNDDDNDIAGMITAARVMLEKRLNRILVPRQVTQRATYFGDGLMLTGVPYMGDLVVAYIDEAGAVQTLDPAAYEVDDSREPAVLRAPFGTEWPVTRAQRNAVALTYTAGYTTVPAPLRQWMLLAIGTMYEQRSGVVAGVSVTHLPEESMHWLWHPYMVYL